MGKSSIGDGLAGFIVGGALRGKFGGELGECVALAKGERRGSEGGIDLGPVESTGFVKSYDSCVANVSASVFGYDKRLLAHLCIS